MNGSENGAKPAPALVPQPYESHFDREELTRLLIQQLGLMGYPRAASVLEAESHYRAEHPTVTQLRTVVLQGQWVESERLLAGLPGLKPKGLQSAQFLIRRQKFLERVEARQTKRALQVLQQELSPLPVNPAKVHALSLFMFCPSRTDLYRLAKWDGAAGQSRHQLLEKLQAHIPAQMMVPPRRLEQLLDRAVQFQNLNCPFHSGEDDYTLLTDHQCNPLRFPQESIHSFESHTDEVWLLAFSPNGAFLASGSKDYTICIWDIEHKVLLHQLRGHEKALASMAWSPDSNQLLTGGHDHRVRLWNIVCEMVLDKHIQPVTACTWFPDGERFLTGGMDGFVYVWNTQARLLRTISAPRLHDMALDAENNRLYVACNERSIPCFDCETGALVNTISLISEVGSISLMPKKPEYLLVSFVDLGVQLWNVETEQLVQSYASFAHGHYVLRPCFAGSDQLYVACGGEDGHIYAWSRLTGKPVANIKAHSGTVNTIAWSPANTNLFATASDDKTVKLWNAEYSRNNTLPNADPLALNAVTGCPASTDASRERTDLEVSSRDEDEEEDDDDNDDDDDDEEGSDQDEAISDDNDTEISDDEEAAAEDLLVDIGYNYLGPELFRRQRDIASDDDEEEEDSTS
ncbi:hypothetical protein IWQ60_008481 [Tieghemiomyces parasiticus]|uniref:Uncharacterized protein n=1 Tax=Tieghemiomyces parasiticus TaxID=78921 RepID=A0A9W7ZWD2_9FUNG|nr:hypothetical protein IWQ60_008481 [Tieghemiomyces parasiticus]